MKEQLSKYVELLFAGVHDAEDVKQEILQNTLDRYDDLIGQGKSPEAAYRLAISGIGDVSEVFSSVCPAETAPNSPSSVKYEKPLWKRLLKAAAIFLYIISAIPLFVLGEMGMETLGLCGTLAIAALATALIMIGSGGSKQASSSADRSDTPLTPDQELRKAVKSIITTVGVCVYFAVSFLTQAWHITWIIFPILAATQGLARACIDLKEAANNEA